MAFRLTSPVSGVLGVGGAKAKDFTRLGLETLRDVLFDFPFRYDDLSHTLAIADAQSGQKVTVQGTITAIENKKAKHGRMMITEAIVDDGTGAIKGVWFHQGFITKILKTGQIVSLAGKVDDKFGLSLVNPVYEVLVI